MPVRHPAASSVVAGMIFCVLAAANLLVAQTANLDHCYDCRKSLALDPASIVVFGDPARAYCSSCSPPRCIECDIDVTYDNKVKTDPKYPKHRFCGNCAAKKIGRRQSKFEQQLRNMGAVVVAGLVISGLVLGALRKARPKGQTSAPDNRTPELATAAGSASAPKVRFACACGKELTVSAAKAGKRARCPGCGEIVVIPAD